MNLLKDSSTLQDRMSFSRLLFSLFFIRVVLVNVYNTNVVFKKMKAAQRRLHELSFKCFSL